MVGVCEKNWNAVRLLCFMAAALLCPTAGHAQEAPAPDARFVIVQSTINIRDTFRLDRWTGATELLSGQEDNALSWRTIPVREPGPAGDRPRYQLSISRVAAKGTYLVDTVSGRSWVLLGNEPAALVWQPIK